MVHSDIKRIYKMKCRLQYLKNNIGRPNLPFSPLRCNADYDAMECIQRAIEELHKAEMILRKAE